MVTEYNNPMYLKSLIEKVRYKLEVEGIDKSDYDSCIKALEKTVNPRLCIDIYNKYINY